MSRRKMTFISPYLHVTTFVVYLTYTLVSVLDRSLMMSTIDSTKHVSDFSRSASVRHVTDFCDFLYSMTSVCCSILFYFDIPTKTALLYIILIILFVWGLTNIGLVGIFIQDVVTHKYSQILIVSTWRNLEFYSILMRELCYCVLKYSNPLLK